MLVMLANKHTGNVRLLTAPSDNEARGVLAQDALTRTPLWSTMMKQYPSVNGHRNLKQADGNDSGRLALSTPPPRPPSDGQFTPQPEQSDYPADEGWQWQEDIRTWAYCHHVLSPMGFKCQKQNPLNPPQQDSPILSLPHKQTPRQPTPGPSGTQWSEELFREPPIPGPSPSSQPPEDDTTREPEPEVAPTQSTEEPF
ncbi:hypothetical protein O181_111098, partial [Austropuccinia psidii MF-1]|nr:hypothetical protein [Austropuccinia psidii MF-1]